MMQEKDLKVLKENNVEIDNIDGKIRFIVEGDAVKNLYEIQKAISSFCRDYVNSEEWEDLPNVTLNAYDDEEDNPIVVMPTNIPMAWFGRDTEELDVREYGIHKNYRRKHLFQHNIWAKVRRLINDLERIIKYNPGSILSFEDRDANDLVISGVRKWKNIVLLKTSLNEDDAITVEELLSLLQKHDGDADVLLQIYWELRGLCEEKWYIGEYPMETEFETFLGYDQDSECNIVSIDNVDIRLSWPLDLEDELEEECADQRVACLGDDGRLHLIREINDDDGMNYIIVNDKKRGKSVTVADFLDYCWDEHGGVVVAYGNDGLLKNIECTDDIFFKDKLNGEDVIAFRLGETLWDPVEDEDIDEDDFFTEDDIIEFTF